jgi:hypothetical protein
MSNDSARPEKRRTIMPVIPIKEAAERLAKAAEKASADDLVQIYTELHPANPLPDVTGAKAERLAKELAARIRAGIEPEQIVDLWRVVFPADRNVYYDEEDDVLRHRERRLEYMEQ